MTHFIFIVQYQKQFKNKTQIEIANKNVDFTKQNYKSR